MTTALTADAMLAALKKWGITPRFYRSDWRTHNRNAQQGWGPLYGFVVHNFGSDISDTNSLAYLYNGDLDRGMPGPLSQFSITDDGTVWVIGWGAANHTGFLDKDLNALVLKDAAPLSADFRPDASGSDPSAGMGRVNDNYIGVEMTYGATPTAAQRASVTRLGAALMDALGAGYTGGSVVGHREATTQRSDPVAVPMWQLRRDINALLHAAPKPAAPVSEEDFMATMTDAEKAKLLGDIAAIKAALPPGAALTRKVPADGSTPRVLDSGDGSVLRSLLERIANQVGAPVDVDETAIATQILAGMGPMLTEAVKAVVDAGFPTADPGAFADAVVARIGQKLSPPAA